MGERDVAAGLDVRAGELRGHLWRALARPGLTGAADLAHAASADAAVLAAERLARGDAAGALRILEAARGIAVYLALEVRPVPRHLADAGKPDRARQWHAAAGVSDPHRLPQSLRRDVLATLLSRSRAASFLAPPTVAEIQAALAATQADALVHLIPGHAVITPVRGPVAHLPLPALTTTAEQVERYLTALARHHASAALSADPDGSGGEDLPSGPGNDIPRAAGGRRQGGAGGAVGGESSGHAERDIFRAVNDARPGFLGNGQPAAADRLSRHGAGADRSRGVDDARYINAAGDLYRAADGNRRDTSGETSQAAVDAGPEDLAGDRCDSADGDQPSTGCDEAPFDTELAAICRWAWDTAMGPLLEHLVAAGTVAVAPARPRAGRRVRVGLPVLVRAGSPPPTTWRAPRLVLVTSGDLAQVPWQAARRGDGTYLLELAAISQIASGRMLCHNAGLPPLPPSAAGLIVADPDTGGRAADLQAARLEAHAIQHACYPRGRLVGRRPDGTASPSGAGTLDQVRAWLATSNPTVGTTLHLACPAINRAGSRALPPAATGAAATGGGPAVVGGGPAAALGVTRAEARVSAAIAGRAGVPGVEGERHEAYLLMAGGERLTATEVLSRRWRPLELVVLAGRGSGRPAAAGDEAVGLPAAFLSGDVRAVLENRWATAPALLFMAHLYRREGCPAGEALRKAQLWMLDPDRTIPPELPPHLAATAAENPIAWAGVTHWGCVAGVVAAPTP